MKPKDWPIKSQSLLCIVTKIAPVLDFRTGASLCIKFSNSTDKTYRYKMEENTTSPSSVGSLQVIYKVWCIRYLKQKTNPH